LCNVVVVTEEEAGFLAREPLHSVIRRKLSEDSSYVDILKSQIISEDAANALMREDVGRFLDERSNSIYWAAASRVLEAED
jgi:hypothetical protein